MPEHRVTEPTVGFGTSGIREAGKSHVVYICFRCVLIAKCFTTSYSCTGNPVELEADGSDWVGVLADFTCLIVHPKNSNCL